MKKKILFIVGGIILLLVISSGIIFYLFQYTEVFGKKLIPLKIESLQIQYVPNMDYKTVLSMNEKDEVVKIQKINLTSKDITTIKKSLLKIRKNDVKTKKNTMEYYKVTINKDIILYIGDGLGKIQKGKKLTNVVVPDECINDIKKYIDKNNKKIVKTIKSENVNVKLEGASITLKDKDNLAYVQDYLAYYPISLKDDYKSHENGYKVEMTLDNNTKVFLYESGIGYIIEKNGESNTATYALFMNDLYGLVKKIYEVSIK